MRSLPWPKIFLLLVFVSVALALPMQAFAASWVTSVLNGSELIPEGCRTGPQTNTTLPKGFIGPPSPKQAQPECGVNEIIQTGVNITRLILGLMGSVALLMFTYGGILYIISAGDRSKVEKAKTVLTNATWGIAIILLSWTIINFLVLIIAGGKIFGAPWTKPPM